MCAGVISGLPGISRLCRQPKPLVMKLILKKAWRNILITGILSIVFGILTYVWPGVTVTTLAWLFAFSVIAQGIALASAGWQGRKDEKNWSISLPDWPVSSTPD
jgi:uncharacterized membrane protein HdeD (DUF308 family)